MPLPRSLRQDDSVADRQRGMDAILGSHRVMECSGPGSGRHKELVVTISNRVLSATTVMVAGRDGRQALGSRSPLSTVLRELVGTKANCTRWKQIPGVGRVLIKKNTPERWARNDTAGLDVAYDQLRLRVGGGRYLDLGGIKVSPASAADVLLFAKCSPTRLDSRPHTTTATTVVRANAGTLNHVRHSTHQPR